MTPLYYVYVERVRGVVQQADGYDPFVLQRWNMCVEWSNKRMGMTPLYYRWNMCVEWSNKRMGMAVGALFVRDNFNQESKAVALEMIHGIR